MSKLLLDSQPLIVIPELAVKIGLNESIVLQQIHYWVEINKKARINFIDGHTWTFNSIDKWLEQFPFWSERTLKRILKSLKEKNLILTSNYNKKAYDRTLWYTVNYLRIEEIETESIENTHSDKMAQCKMSSCHYGKGQVDTMQNVNVAQPIPETTKEITNTYEEEVLKAYKEVKGRYLNSRERKVLKELLQSHSKDLILKAIDVMVTDAEKITLKYITSTLEDWKTKEIQTVEEVDKMRLEWQESKKKHIRKPTEYKPKGKVSNFNNFKQRDYDFNDLEKKLTDHEEVLKEADCSKCVVCRNGKCFIGKEPVDGKCANYNEKNVG